MRTLGNPAVWIPLTALVTGLAAAALFRLALLRFARRRNSRTAAALARFSTRPLLLLLPVVLARFVQPLLELEPAFDPLVRHTGTLLLILGFGWLLISLVYAGDELLRAHLLTGVGDEKRRKRILTRLAVLDRVLTTLIAVFTAAAMMVTFPEGRAIGTSILASAGIAALVLGIAARPAAEGLIAGLRVALTEPLHLDDVVIVEGEWGQIEEITSAYVVVRIWDRRRLIVPLSTILEKPFQNWTRSGTDLLAQVTVEVDYSTPVARVREEVGRIVTSSKLWNGELWNLQVTEAGERTMRLRILASAANSDDAWNIRCEIREKLITHLQEQYPWALPRIRTTVESGPQAAGAGAPDPGPGR
ncbi:MAG TPA: mechanosensitive ion channel family protein [Vicinamibacteria bacterium]|nr:mechanosensitive ion channel family protein [Vicinamibacteria bacterium]